jgi:hypothetical protein
VIGEKMGGDFKEALLTAAKSIYKNALLREAFASDEHYEICVVPSF